MLEKDRPTCKACEGNLDANCIHGSAGERYARAYEEYEREVEQGKANQRAGLKTDLSRGAAAKIVADKYGLAPTSLKKFAKISRVDPPTAKDIVRDKISVDAGTKKLRNDPNSELHSDTYLSPDDLFTWIRDRILGGKIDLDPATIALADGTNPVGAAVFYTHKDKGETKDWAWAKTIYINPPFSEPGPWIRKIRETMEQNPSCKIVLCCKLDSSTRWFQDAIKIASSIYHPGKRIPFDKIEDGKRKYQGSPDFPTVLIAFGDVQLWAMEESVYGGIAINLAASRASKPEDKSGSGVAE